MTASDPITDLDLHGMRRALELARRGIVQGDCSQCVDQQSLPRSG